MAFEQNLSFLGEGPTVKSDPGTVGKAGSPGTGFMATLSENPELFAIALDMIGSKMAPESPFAGVGQALGKSSLAAKAEEESRVQSSEFQTMIGNLVKSMTNVGQDGTGKIEIVKDKDGVFQVKTTGESRDKDRRVGEIGGVSPNQGAAEPAVKTAEQFAKDFEGGF